MNSAQPFSKDNRSRHYAQVATAELERRVPELHAMRRPEPPPASFGQLSQVSRGAFGPAGCLFILVAWPIWRLNRYKYPPTEVVYSGTAPSQPRPLQVLRAYNRLKLRPIELRVFVDGWAPRIRLHFGDAQVWSENRWAHHEQHAQLITGRVPFDPLGDAAFIADTLRGILDDRVGVLRYIRYGEIGMGSGDFALANHILISRGTDPSSLEELRSAAEAIFYTWSGRGDHHLIAPRYTPEQLRDGREIVPQPGEKTR